MAASDSTPDMVQRLLNEANGYFKDDCFEQALGLYCKAYPQINKHVESSTYDDVLYGLAYCSYEQGKYSDAARHYSALLSLRSRSYGEDHEEIATIRWSYADSLLKSRQFGNAIPVYRKLLQFHQSSSGPKSLNHDLITTQHNLANALCRHFDFTESAKLDRQNLKLLEHTEGQQEWMQTQILGSRYQLGVNVFHLQDYNEALELANQCTKHEPQNTEQQSLVRGAELLASASKSKLLAIELTKSKQRLPAPDQPGPKDATLSAEPTSTATAVKSSRVRSAPPTITADQRTARNEEKHAGSMHTDALGAPLAIPECRPTRSKSLSKQSVSRSDGASPTFNASPKPRGASALPEASVPKVEMSEIDTTLGSLHNPRPPYGRSASLNVSRRRSGNQSQPLISLSGPGNAETTPLNNISPILPNKAIPESLLLEDSLLPGIYDVQPKTTPDEFNEQWSDQWFQNFEKCTLAIFQYREKDQPNFKYIQLLEDDRVKIAILDSGVNMRNPFIRAIKRRVQLQRRSFVIRGGQRASEDDDPIGHGTHNVLLVDKMLPHARIYVAKVFDNQEIKPDELAEAIEWAIDEWKVDIIVMALGFGKVRGDTRFQKMEAALEKARREDTLVFAAASNCSIQSPVAYPASTSNVFCIFATDGAGNKPAFNPSIQIPHRSFAVLGEHVEPVKGAGRKSGTSKAVAIAASIAGVMLYLVRSLKTKVPPCNNETKRFVELRRIAGTVEGMNRILSWLREDPNNNGGWIRPWKKMDWPTSNAYIPDSDSREDVRIEILNALAKHLRKKNAFPSLV